MSVVVVGSLNMDLVIRSERHVKPGETMNGYGFRTICGGKGANQAIACARLGADTSMIGCVGRDNFGQRLKLQLNENGVDCSGVREIDDVSTGVAVINVSDDGENSIILDSGANAHMSNEITLSPCSYVLLQLEIPVESVIAALKAARAVGAKTLLTPAPARELPDEIWQFVDILALNETELAFYSDGPGELLDKGVGLVLATMGERGGRVVSKDKDFSYEAVKVKAIDTTAAGDTFCAAVAVALGEGKTIEEAVSFAARASAITCTKVGASASIPYRSEVEKFV